MVASGNHLINHSTPTSTDGVQRCGRATFARHRCSPIRVAVAVRGEIDAVNGRALGRYVERQISCSRQLVLDLRAVDFSGTPAFTALYYVAVRCARSDVDWAIVGGHPVQRLLRVCDPHGALPLEADLSSALLRLDRLAKHRRQLVWTGATGWHVRRSGSHGHRSA